MMKKVSFNSVIVLVLLTLVPFVCEAEETTVKLDKILLKAVERDNFSGSVLVARDDQILLEKGYGSADLYHGQIPNTEETRYLIGSNTKSFTALAILQLDEKELISLDDPVTEYIPNYANFDGVTIHHLLTNASGIPDYYSSTFDFIRYWGYSKEPETILHRFKNSTLLFEPGSDYSYSNTNYLILAMIIEQVTGERYGKYLEKNIFKPLGLDDTGYQSEMESIEGLAKGYLVKRIFTVDKLDLSNFLGSGCLYSNVGDLYQYIKALNQEQLLEPTSMDKLFTPWAKRATGYYGYGWAIKGVDDQRLIYHTGLVPGFHSGLYNYIDEDIIIIILSNNQESRINSLQMILYQALKQKSSK